jgi:hypothetical protein
MKDKLISGCFSVVIVIIFIVMLLSAISMIKNGAYIKGGFLLFAVLLVVIPVLIGLFSKSKKNADKEQHIPQIPVPTTNDKLIELVKCVTNNNAEMVGNVLNMIKDPEGFCKTEIENNPEQPYDYNDYLLDLHRETNIALLHIVTLYALGNAKFVVNFDWKDDLETFLYGIRNLKCFKENNLPIDEAALSTLNDIPQQCFYLNEQWKSIGFQTVFIDTNSDEYWVTIVPLSEKI